MKRLRNVNGNTTYIYKEISFITILDVTTRQQNIANPPMEDSYGRLHMNIDVREIKQVVSILHIYRFICAILFSLVCASSGVNGARGSLALCCCLVLTDVDGSGSV